MTHLFTPPVGRPWSRCAICGLAESAHDFTDAEYETPDTYRCPYCVDRGKHACLHGREHALSIKGESLNRGNHAQPPERG